MPRIGRKRALKFALESYWAGEADASELEETARRIRDENRSFLLEAGVEIVPSNYFSFYDHVLDMAALLGAVPARFKSNPEAGALDTYFAMARGVWSRPGSPNGRAAGGGAGQEVLPMEMTKWFNTNYHYIVPELGPDSEFALSGNKPFDEHEEDMEGGSNSCPVLLGPLSFLLLAKPADGTGDFDRLSLVDKLVPVYGAMFGEFAKQGTEWVQFDEPVLSMERTDEELAALRTIYRRMAAITRRPKMLVKTYFDHLGPAYKVLKGLPVEGIGVDLVYGARNIELIREAGKLKERTLFAGIVDGRNVWASDLAASLDTLEPLAEMTDDLVVSTSCSLMHVPLDLDDDPDLDPEVRPWLAFAVQKVREVVALTKALNEGREAVSEVLEASTAALASRRSSPRVHNQAVRERTAGAGGAEASRYGQYPHRRKLQDEAVPLPMLPTTTIGSFPQTPEIRRARARAQKGELTAEAYEAEMKSEIERVIRFQERIGLDVLVHGEPERNDMVQYFAEQMEGYIFTKNGWVQSYGSRCVRPPVIFGDVSRPKPMTLDWYLYAQSLTDRPVKGMLTGPVTMLMWSFVRDDQPRSETCRQLALAIRDEVEDLEKAGARIVQVDEPALREGLPLRKEDWPEYLRWAVECFRIATGVAGDRTQIQTHMCYADFGDIIDSIDQLDADVALIEASRSQMELLDDFRVHGYARGLGPGVYDVHSPRVPPVDEVADNLRRAVKVLDPSQIWVNPDCGLKTRTWEEAEPALVNLVEAARRLRSELGADPGS